MAKLIYGKEEWDVKDGNEMLNASENLGVPFGCYVGHCGACRVTILEGKENLSPLTQDEKDAGLDENQRLACKAKIKKGIVKIDF